MWAKLALGIRHYIVPGLIFQSVVVGGGYGTGREIVAFFMPHGAVGGLLGMLVSCLVWGAVLSVAFEFARKTQSYNYRTFFQRLLGPLWPLFELIYLLIVLLVLAVLGSASAEMVSSSLGLPGIVGSATLMAVIGMLAFYGSKIIERFLTWWSLVLYLTYFVLLIWVVNNAGEHIADVFTQNSTGGAWLVDGVRYSAYNLVALAAVLFVVPHFTRTREAIGAGMLAGVLAIIPGIFVFITLLAAYPQIIDAPVPMLAILDQLQAPWFMLLFQIMLFGTFIETGIGIIHAVNERIAYSFAQTQRAFPDWLRATIALLMLSFAIYLAQMVGIIKLIADGYGWLSYGYMAVVILPLMTLGIWAIVRQPKQPV